MNSLFHQRLKSIRLEKVWTQQHFAEQIGCSRATYNHYENGNRQPDADTITKICQAADVSADYLLGLSGTKKLGYDTPSRITGLSEESIEYLDFQKNNISTLNTVPGRVNDVVDFIIQDADFQNIFESKNPYPLLDNPDRITIGHPAILDDVLVDDVNRHILDALKDDWKKADSSLCKYVQVEDENDEMDDSEKELITQIILSGNGPSASLADYYEPPLEYREKVIAFTENERDKSKFLDVLIKYLSADEYNVSLCSSEGCYILNEVHDIVLRLGDTHIVFPSEESAQLIESKLFQDVTDALRQLKRNYRKYRNNSEV